MARLNDSERDAILSEFHIGKSQNYLAKKYLVSTATINKLCKGITPKYADKVNAVSAIKCELSNESKYLSECFDAEVNEKTKHLKLINDNATKLADKLSKMTDEIDSAQDLKFLCDANDRLAITLRVADRHAPKQDISLTNANQVNITPNEITKAIFEALPD